MPKHRKAHPNALRQGAPQPPQRLPHVTSCSYCGAGRDDRPLLIVSPDGKCATCSTCALTMVEQTFAHFSGVEKWAKDMQDKINEIKKRKLEADPLGDKTDEAIRKAEHTTAGE